MKKFFELHSIKKKIFLYYFTLITALLLVITLIFSFVSYTVLRARVTSSQERELQLVANSFDLMLENAVGYTVAVATNNDVQELLRQLDDDPEANRFNIIKDLGRVATGNYSLNRNIEFWDIMDAEGNLLNLFEYDTGIIDELVTPELLELFRGRKSALLLGPYPMKKYRELDHTQNTLIIAKPIVDLDTGGNLGICFAFVNENRLNETYSKNVPLNGSNLYVADANGDIISSSDKNGLYSNISDYFSHRNDALGNVARIRGEDYLVYTASLGKYDWKLYSAVPLSAVTDEIALLRNLVFLFGAAGIAAALLLALYIAKKITSPILALAQTMRTIRKGENVRAAVAGSDEIGALCAGFNSLMDTQDALIREAKEARDLNLEFRFRLFQAQINPHFLYNALESIISLVQLNMDREAVQALMHLAGFYRLSLNDGHDLVSVRQEIELTADYLYVQKTRYVEFFDFGISVDCVGIDKYTMPKLTLQPIVENSIYHGIKPKGVRGNITISVTEDADDIIIEVLDDGVGMSQETARAILEAVRIKDFGLASVDARLKLLYGDAYGISIDSVPGAYTQVVVRVPKRRKHD